jgi:PEP-CTERM motif
MKLFSTFLISAALATTAYSGAAVAATESAAANDTFATAQDLGTLASGNSLSVTGDLEYAPISGDSRDYYTFNLATQGLVSFSLFTPNGASTTCCSSQDPLLGVFSADGTLLFGHDDISDTNKNAFASSTLDIGQYYVRVTDAHVSGWPYTLTITQTAAAVPEPETYAMMLAGLGALGWVSRRRRSA